jgi:hypothetical protein
MPTKKLIYQFKITLKDTKPPIWRRIQVPSTYNFWDLHVSFQDAMGWKDYHLHEFIIKDPLTSELIYIGIPDEQSDYDLERTTLPGWKHKISKYISLINPTIEYIYDYGDNWQHKVVLEEILPVEKDVKYPRCIQGKRNGPPEDCGGPWGYLDMLEVLSEPKNIDYQNTKAWIESMKEGPFYPEHFNPSEVVFDDPKERFKIAFHEE